MLPILSAVLTSLIGVAINLATEWRENLLAWAVVFALTIIVAVVSIVIQRRQLPDSNSTVAPGLIMRTIETTKPDGTRVETTEIFDEEVARQRIRQDSLGVRHTLRG
jgi:hypothetical protein